MFEVHSINAEHKDLIHDIAYDFYGQRMATCSSDQFVKVWDQDDHENWHLRASWKAHSGSVWKVTWAHPEFGQVLATCSFDRTAAIWEEIVGEGSVPGERGMRHWVRRTTLVDSRTSVTDIKFAPKSLGLLLATCSTDGVIRIYEAPDIMNLSQWTLQHEISCKQSCSCLSWNPSFSRLHSPMIAVGSDDTFTTGGKVFIYEYSENTRSWSKTETLGSVTDSVHDLAFAPNLGRSYHLLAVATKDVRIITLKPILESSGGQNRFDIQLAAKLEDHYSPVWRVTWNVTGTIAASSGDDGCVRLWKANYMDYWKCVAVLKGDGTQAQNESAGQVVQPAQSVSTPANQSTTTRSQQEGNDTIATASKLLPITTKGRFQKMTWRGGGNESTSTTLGISSPASPPAVAAAAASAAAVAATNLVTAAAARLGKK